MTCDYYNFFTSLDKPLCFMKTEILRTILYSVLFEEKKTNLGIMNNTKTKIKKVVCRMCLKLKPLKICKKLEGVFSEILEILKLKLIAFVDPMICEKCGERLENAFNFKTIYTDTEDFLFPYTNSSKNMMLDLQTIYWEEKKGQECPNKDFKICRLCLEPTDCFLELKEPTDKLSIAELFREYLPEVDIYITDNPIICEVCHDYFREFINFFKECSETEKNVMNYCGTSNIDKETNELYRFILPQNENYQLSDISIQLVPRTQEIHSVTEESIHISPLEPTLNLATDLLDFGCEICSFRTQSKYRLQRHMVVHIDPSMGKLFKCTECPMETNHKYLFRTHIKKMHLGIVHNKFKCTQCKFATDRKGDFDRHLLRHKDPSELEKFQCENCSYETYSKQYMKNHSKMHLNPSETIIYYCENCEYKSKNKHKVIRHQLIHKDISEVETFDCTLCNYKTKEKSSLKLHMRIHTDPPDLYNCNICLYKTRYKQSLNKHVEIVHTITRKTKMFKCNLCDKSFKMKGYLKSHMNRHNNKELFPCDSCNYKANLKGNLNAHVKRFHNENVEMFECDTCSFKSKFKGSLAKHMVIHKRIPEIKMHE